MWAPKSIHRWSTVFVLLASCGTLTPGPARHVKPTSGIVLHETFAEPLQVQARWVFVSPKATDSAISIEGKALRLTASSENASLHRRFDIAELRGDRLRISAHVRTDSSSATAAVTLLQSGPVPNYSNVETARSTGPNAWRTIQAVADVDLTSLGAEIAVVVEGQGSAWFDDIMVEDLGPSPRSMSAILSTTQIANLITLARTTMLVRYRDPSDQAAELDWNAFLPEAVLRILRVSGSAALLSELQDIFGPIAPALEFSTQRVDHALTPPRGAGSHLARWHHLGFGSGSVPPYSSWREGRDVDLGELELTLPIANLDVTRCKRARLVGAGRNVGPGHASLFVNFGQPGDTDKQVETPLSSDLHEVAVDAETPADTHSVKLGLRVSGQASTELRSLALACDDAVAVRVDLKRTTWKHGGWDDLYESKLATCDSKDCLIVSRIPPGQSFVPTRDILDADVGNGIWLHMPLAVWSDGQRTYPVSADVRRDRHFALSDLETRLAAIISAWGTASLFYPYFSDQQIDWALELPRALSDAAASSSPNQLHASIAKLIAKLRDNHATIVHPALPINGILPVALRRFGDELVVIGNVAEYAKALPVGTRVIDIDGVPAIQAYDDMASRVSAATASWADIFIPYWLTLGPQGTFATLRVRTERGHEMDALLPHLPRSTYDDLIREPRPASGTQLSSGVYYVDLQGLTVEQWHSVLPSLQHARAIVLDERGVPTDVALTVLGHFLDHAVDSPTWQTPLLESGGYRTAHWEIRPARPRLHASLIVLTDGRVTSYGETVLQIVRDNHLATLVGEPSGGTNGNIAEARLPGGFIMHFTGMRVPLPDGTAIQGKGIIPDHIVHPTIEGVRAGRDEVLIAAVTLAEKS